MKRRIIPCLSILFFLPVFVFAQDQNCGLEERWELQPDQSHTFQIEVSGYANDRLEDPLQGLCGVEIGFIHNTLKKFEVTLVSPDGQRLQLIGPNVDGGPFFSLLANWQVIFLPSTDQADPPEGFGARWDNDQPTVDFGAGGTGSFFPYGDDLDNVYAAGAVNGNWTVEVSSLGSAWDGGLVGIIYHFRLVFCDETGVPCCFAEAGTLRGDDLIACTGDPALDIPPPEVRYITSIRPDSLEYGYTYLIEEDGIILEQSDDPDLSAYPAGDYAIYGLSYDLDDEAIVNDLGNGTLSLADLRADLEGATPSFCGDLGEAPVRVQVVETELLIAPPDVLTCAVNEVTLDASASVPSSGLELEWTGPGGEVFGSDRLLTVTAPGTYTLSASLPDGTCLKTETVEVVESKAAPTANAGPPASLTCTITEVRLDGGASSAGPEFTYAWSTADGNIVDGAETARPLIDAPGAYRLVVTDTRNGCSADAQVSVDQDRVAPAADAGMPPTLTCAELTVAVGGPGTPTGGDYSYQWTTTDGSIIAGVDEVLAEVDAPGLYRLLVTDTRNGCANEASVAVGENRVAPIADGGPDALLTCAESEVTLGGSATSTGPDYRYSWTTTGGSIISGATAPQALVNASGVYELTVLDIRNGCAAASTVEVGEDTNAPIADAGLPATLTCREPILQIGSGGSSQGPDIAYQWRTTDGRFASRTDTLFALVDAPGTYELTVLDTRTGCERRSQVTIDEDRRLPRVDPGPSQAITCTVPLQRLEGGNSDAGPSFSYDWRTVDGNVVEGANTLRPLVDRAGTYELLIVDTGTGCRDSAAVVITADTIAPRAVLQAPPSLNCDRREVSLDATASDQGAGIAFLWRASEGGVVPPGAQASLNPVVRTAGRYELLLVDERNGCRDSAAVAVQDTASVVLADPGPGGALTCRAATLQLDGSASTSGLHIVYEWSTADGRIDSDTALPRITVSAPGDYTLTVIDTVTRCRASAAVEVVEEREAPLAEAGPDQLLTCSVDEVFLDGSASMATGPLNFQWDGPCLLSGADGAQARTDCPGTYYLTVEDQNNGCLAIDSVVVRRDDSFPIAEAGDPVTLTCSNPVGELNGAGSSQSGAFGYQWTGPSVLAGANTLQPQIDAPGWYTLAVTDLSNNCVSLDSVEVGADRTPPAADAGSDQVIDCDQTVVSVGGANSSTGPFFTYRWSSPNGVISAPNGMPTLSVDIPGTYELQVTDTRNGCTAQDAVVVALDRDTPLADAGPDAELNCATTVVTLNGSNSSPSPGPDIVYEWSGDCLIGDPALPVIEADCPGAYTLTVTNTRTGCTDTDLVQVRLDESPPSAVVADSAVIDCTTGVAILDGRRSSGGTLAWLRNGRPTGRSDALIQVTTPGAYQLVVTNTSLGCTDTAAVEVILDCQPLAATAPAGPLTCTDDLLRLDGRGSSAGPQMRYRWFSEQPGCIVEGGEGLQPLVRCGGEYRLIVTNTAVQLSDTASVQVAVDTVAPVARLTPAGRLTCTDPEVTLDGSASSAGPGLEYAWTDPAGDTIGTGPVVVTNSRGVHLFEVLNPVNGCRDVAFASVEKDDDVPEISFSDNVFPCLQDTFGISATVEPASASYTFVEWSAPGLEILAGPDPASIRVTSPGAYTLLVRNEANGCVAEATVRVRAEVCAPCVEVATPDTLTCSVNELQLEARFCEDCQDCSVSWITNDGNIAAGASTLTPTVDAPGTYELTVVEGIGFTTVLRTTVLEDRLPPPVDAGPDQFITCVAPSVLLGVPDTTGVYAYEWQRADGLPLSGPTGGPQLRVELPGSYVLEMTSLRTGCRASDVAVVEESLDPPLADAGPPRELTCEEPLATLDGTGSSTGAQMLYAWQGADVGPVASGGGTRNPVVDRAGWYYLTVTNSATGCFAVDSTLVTRSGDLPPLPVLTDQLISCEEPAVVLRGAAPNAVDYSYRWCTLDEANAPVDCREVLEWTVTEAGRYRFEITDRRSGCMNSKIVTVRRNVDTPQVEAGPAMVLGCGEEGVVLQGAGSLAGAPLAFSWRSAAGAIIADATTLRPTVFSPDRYYLRVENSDNGCVAIDSVEVTREAQAPDLVIAEPSLLSCSRREVMLAARATTVSGNVQWRWQTEDGRLLSGGSTATPMVGAPGLYEVSVTDPGNACTSVAGVQVMGDLEAPVAAVENAENLVLGCATTRVRLDATPSQPVSDQPLLYSWRVVSGGTLIGDPAAVAVDVEAAGIYRLVVTEMRNGCRDTADVQVQRSDDVPRAVIAASASSITCSDPAVMLDGSGSGDGADLEYRWLDEAGSLLAQGVPTLSVSSGGNYSLQVRDPRNGCEDETAVFVGVDTLKPAAIIQMPDVLDCDRPAIELDGTASSSGADFAYRWRSDGGNIVSGANSTIAVADAPGAYQLTVANLRNNCRDSAAVVVEQLAGAIEAVAYTVLSPSCDGQETGSLRIDSISGGSAPYVYALNDNRFTTESSFGQLQAGQYVLRVQDSSGCEWSDSFNINDPTTLRVDLGPDQLIDLGDTVRLTAVVEGDYERLRWEPADLVALPGSLRQLVAPLRTTTYSVLVESGSCRAVDYITITVAKERNFFIPTAFSPNDDGINDRFYLQGGEEAVRIQSIRIFDRWGQLVFQAEDIPPNDPAEGWDGYLDGRPMNPAVFVYHAEVEFLDGRVVVFQGDVALIR